MCYYSIKTIRLSKNSSKRHVAVYRFVLDIMAAHIIKGEYYETYAWLFCN